MKRYRFVLLVLLLTILFPAQVHAAGSIDLMRDSSIVISYQDEEKALTGAVFAAFRVASVNEFGRITPLEDFEQFDVNITGENAEGWKRMSGALEDHILQSAITPTASGTIDEQGILLLEKIPQGLYLISGTQHIQDQMIYTTDPILVMLPSLDRTENAWIYDVTVYPKHTSRQESEPEIPEQPQTPPEESKPQTPSSTLPQTGQLWWPVFLLLAAGLFLIILGLLRRRRCFGSLLIAAALVLATYNLYEDCKARKESQETLEKLEEQLLAEVEKESFQKEDLPIEDVIPVEIPDYIINPYMEMPVREIDGQDYIGVLEIEACELSLPVISEWNYSRLKIAPCRYDGSAYTDNLIIAAHNYKAHFRNLQDLKEGERVIFTDMDGNIFTYQVVEREILAPEDVEEMKDGKWDLTLFTCTLGGASRVTVRCEKAE